MSQAVRRNGIVSHLLNEKDRKRLRRLVDAKGVAGVARMFGVSRGVIAAAAGGLNIRRGSIELVRTALASTKETST